MRPFRRMSDVISEREGPAFPESGQSLIDSILAICVISVQKKWNEVRREWLDAKPEATPEDVNWKMQTTIKDSGSDGNDNVTRISQCPSTRTFT